MVWKPKEKELSLEETIALAKSELSPFWAGRSPLFAGSAKDGKYSIFQLDPEFSEKIWLLFLVDSTSFHANEAFHYIEILGNRYGRYGVHCLCVIEPLYEFLNTPQTARSYYEMKELSVPIVVDHDRSLALSLGLKSLPCVAFFKKGALHSKLEQNWPNEVEGVIHRLLRKGDPGLPLLPLYLPEDPLPREKSRIEFGKKSAFKPKKISGNWQQDAQKIFTNDPAATIQISFSAKGFGIVARTLSDSGVQGKILIEVNGEIIHEQSAGPNLEYDEAALSCIKVREGRLYQAASSLDGNDQLVTLSFPEAKNIPIALYGMRLI